MPRFHPLSFSFVLALLAGPLTAAQTLARTWEPNATVRVELLQAAQNRLFLGGDFTLLGPHTGNTALFLTTTGQLQTNFPVFQHFGGWGRAAVSDGSGGWYVASDAYQVDNPDGSPGLSGRLVHIQSSGMVDPLFAPNPDGSVQALALYAGKLYVAGLFNNIAGQPQSYLAALDPANGSLAAWNPGLNAAANDLALSGSRLYVAGNFTYAGATPRAYLACFDLSASPPTLTAWNPSANASVNRLLVPGSLAYAAGAFTSVGGQARNYFAELDASGSTGWATSLDPQVSAAPSNQGWGLALANNTLYLGGAFSTVQGQPRANAAALSLPAGSLAVWSADTAGGGVYDLAVGSGQVYLGGWFQRVSNRLRQHLARVDASTGAVDAWNPGVGGTVFRLALPGDGRLVVLGNFWQAGGVDRLGLASLNLATGRPDAFACDLTRAAGTARAEALALSNTTLLVGGSFDAASGSARANLAAVDAGSGVALAWNPSPDGEVRALAADAANAYFAGTFANASGTPRAGLAAAALAGAGTPTAFNPGCDGPVSALRLDNGVLYVGGSFAHLGGSSRANLGAVDASGSTGWALAFNPQPNNAVFALAGGSGALYAGGSFTQIGGAARQRLSKLDASGAADPAFDAGSINGAVQCLLLLNNVLYYGGSFTPNYLSAAMADTGAISLAARWGYLWANGNVLALAGAQLAGSTANDLYVGGAFYSAFDNFRPFYSGVMDDLSSNPYGDANVGPLAGQNAFRFFPQPVRDGNLCGSVAANAGDAIEVRLYNSVHQLAAVIRRTAAANAGVEHFCEDARELAPGLYTVRVWVNGVSRGASNLVVGR